MESAPAGSGMTALVGKDPTGSNLAVGCFASICRDRLADRLLEFSRTRPEIDIGLHEMPRGALLPALRGGALSVAVLPGKPEPDLSSIELWHDHVLVAMAATHRLARYSAIPRSELRDEIFLVSRQQFGGEMHRFLAQRILPLGPSLNASITDLGPRRTLDRVASAEGLALICASHSDHGRDAIVVRPVLAGGGQFPVRAYWAGAEPAAPIAALIQSLTSPQPAAERI